jgi:hypothetical protein
MVLVTVMLWLSLGWEQGQLDCGGTEAEPRLITVVVPDRAAERLVRQQLPRVRIVVLQTEPGEPLEVLLERAWDCRDADCFFYDPERECLSLASLRERLCQQGVVPINLTKQLANSQRLPLAQPATKVAGR